MGSEEPTHYERLGVAETATNDEILGAYRAVVRRLHPDLHPEWSEAEREAAESELIEVVVAHQVLRDPHRRAIYDGATGAALSPARPDDPDYPLDSDLLDRLDEYRNHEPPAGFVLHGSFTFPPFFRKPRYARTEWDRGADALNPGVSLQALQPDLSPLRSYAPDQLWRLRAERLPVTDDQLRHLSEIESLSELALAYTDITDEGLRHICELPRLRVLDLWGTKITDEGLRTISRAASTLDRLNIGLTAVTDAGMVHLRYMHTLDELNIRGTAIRGSGLSHLHQLVTLDWVALPSRVSRRARRALRDALPNLHFL